MCTLKKEAQTKIDRLIVAVEKLCAILEMKSFDPSAQAK